jgi:hypothetical protein
MKKQDVQIGGLYVVKVSGNMAVVKITGESPYGGWDGRNVHTGRDVRIRTAARLRRPVAVKTVVPDVCLCGAGMVNGKCSVPGCVASAK